MFETFSSSFDINEVLHESLLCCVLEHPAHLRVPEAAPGAVRVELRVNAAVVLDVVAGPLQRRAAPRRCRKDQQDSLDQRRALEAAVCD